MIRLAVIGAGSRATWMLRVMSLADPDVRLVAVADPDEASARRRLAERGVDHAGARFFETAGALLETPEAYDGVVLGTPCFMHAPLAAQVAAAGLPLYLEKPVAISREQLATLRQAMRGRERKVVVSFPLRVTPLFGAAMAVIRSGRLGTINQVQAINNVPYGGIYFGTWYRDARKTGGLWLAKATHDFDCINLLTGARPVSVAAMEGRRVYGGEMPFDLTCSRCDRTDTCMESPQNIERRGDAGGMFGEENTGDHACAFSEGIANHDAAAALVLYDNAVHATYSQNFVTRRPEAARRGAIVTGYAGTLEFDWPGQFLRVVEHHTGRVERTDVTGWGEGHGGADEVLARNFLDVIRDLAAPAATLEEGLLSAAMCLAARESAGQQRFVSVADPS